MPHRQKIEVPNEVKSAMASSGIKDPPKQIGNPVGLSSKKGIQRNVIKQPGTPKAKLGLGSMQPQAAAKPVDERGMQGIRPLNKQEKKVAGTSPDSWNKMLNKYGIT